jgi:hypothetical protein
MPTFSAMRTNSATMDQTALLRTWLMNCNSKGIRLIAKAAARNIAVPSRFTTFIAKSSRALPDFEWEGPV